MLKTRFSFSDCISMAYRAEQAYFNFSAQAEMIGVTRDGALLACTAWYVCAKIAQRQGYVDIADFRYAHTDLLFSYSRKSDRLIA